MGEAVVAALGIALSPFAVIPAGLLLFTSRPRVTSAGFALGWFAGVAAITGVSVLLADVLTLPENPPEWVSWVRVVLGAGLVLAGLATYVRRSPDAASPTWVTSLEESTPGRAVRLGLMASVLNPKVVLLAAAGGFSLGSAVEGMTGEVVAIVGFALLASATTVLPVVAVQLLGKRALEALGRAVDWVTSHMDAAVALVLVVIGILLVWKGATVVVM